MENEAAKQLQIDQVMYKPYPFAETALIRHLVEHPEAGSENLWFAAVSTLAYFGEAGRAAFHYLSSFRPNYLPEKVDRLFDKALEGKQQGIGPITYKKIVEYGFQLFDDTELTSPARYIEWLWQEETLYQMGIEFDEEKQKAKFNPNVFAEYFQQEQQLLIHEGSMFYEYSSGVWRHLPEYKLKRRIRELFQSVRKNLYRSWMGEQAIDMLKIAVPETQELNPRKDLINLMNGMLDTNTFQLLPHDPSYFSTTQIQRNYEPEAKCERFQQFVAEIMEDDAERVAVIQEIMGYLLTADTKIHMAYFFFGGGSNGKSLLADIITSLVGEDNVANISLKDLEKPFRRSNLIGKTVNIATENENPKGFNSQTFKAVVSGDRIMVERKFENPVSYVPICKLLFAVNRLPSSQDTTYGFFRRMFILPFRRRFSGDQADPNLKQKLETELPGILNWALEGLHRLRQQNFRYTHSAVVEAAIEQYREEQTPLKSFMTDMLYRVADGGRVAKPTVVETYYLWCRRNGLGDIETVRPQAFWAEFVAHCGELGLPYEVQKSNSQRYLKNLALRSIDESNQVVF